jgi:predicted tellurium resistance membrane protein TerC
MQELFTMQNLGALFMLILLQAVLGFDNLLYISLESKKAPKADQARVRKLGIGLAIFLRIGLLFLLTSVIGYFQKPFWSPRIGEMITSEIHGESSSISGYLFANFNVHSLIVLGGGMFIIWTAIKEIWHMISQEQVGDSGGSEGSKSSKSVIVLIVLMNLIFSFDSILSAMALTTGLGSVFVEMTLMIIAIVISGILMMVMANTVSEFLRKNRMFEVLGLFVLLIVGVMLVTEGGHLANLAIFGNPIVPMSKTTFYFVIIVLVLVDVIQTKYQKKIIARETAEEVKVLGND